MNKIATRESYGKALAQLIVENENVVVLDADLTKSTKTIDAKNACGERHFNMGIAEGNMMSVAAGLAASDKIVYASSFSVFATGRAFEQIRNSICYPNLNVKVCGTHAGLTVGEDGASHQAIEDIAIMRSLPNMKVIQPCDDIEARQCIKAIASIDGPCYVRLGRGAVDCIHDDNYVFEFGKGEVLVKGSKVAIVATGLMVQQSLSAIEQLKHEDINPTLVNIHTIKPIDTDLIKKIAQDHDLIITCEEHNIIGGLGSAVCEIVAQSQGAKVVRLGVNDTFGESGKPNLLLEKYGLTPNDICKVIKENI